LGVYDSYGIGGAIIMAEAFQRQDRMQEENDTLIAAAAESEGRLVAYATVHPSYGDAARAEIRRCAAEGARGLKFHPWLQGFSLTDPEFGECCALAADLGLPVVFHDGTPIYSTTEQVLALAGRYPSTTFVLGHSGLLFNWRTTLYLESRPNVYATLCGVSPRAMEIICARVPTERLLWGSDFGFGTKDFLGYRLRLFGEIDIGDDVRTAVLEENPARLLATNRG
jgi:predicted TIM-barrel fold metal-dependent hydrolase